MIHAIETPDAWAAEPLPNLHGSVDAEFFLDAATRKHRVRPDAPGLVAAVHRDGRRHLLEMPHDDIAGLTSEAFARQLFEIGERYMSAAAGETKPRGRSFFSKIFSRRANANRNASNGPRERHRHEQK